MITIQEIETALQNAGWTPVEIYIEQGILGAVHCGYHQTGDYTNEIWRFMFGFCGIKGLLQTCYETGIHFKKENIGVHDYDAYNNTEELIEDLRSWL
jgi:hypothetical protein